MTPYKYFLFFLISINLSFSNSIEDRYYAVATRIIKNAQADSTAYKRLEYLCDTYGPRLSGSKNLERSIEWIIKKMKQDDLENVNNQGVKVPNWVRGDELATLIKPLEGNLSMLGLDGSIATSKKGLHLK